MIKHHPDDNLLTEYANGTLDTPQAIAVKAHLHFCSQCQHNIKQLEEIGGVMLENLSHEPVDSDCFDQLMEKINQDTQPIRYVPQNTPPSNAAFIPPLVDRLVSEKPLKWRRVNSVLKSACLPVGQQGYEVSLQKIRAGGTAPDHDHRGLEMTVVLQGSFSDQQGLYQQGDFVVKLPGDAHQPVASCNEDCLCLSVQDAPVKLTGVFSRLLNPFIRLQSH